MKGRERYGKRRKLGEVKGIESKVVRDREREIEKTERNGEG